MKPPLPINRQPLTDIHKNLIVTVCLLILLFTGGCQWSVFHKDPTRWMLRWFDNLADKVDLTDSQTITYQDLRFRLEEDLEKLIQGHDQFSEELLESINEKNGDFLAFSKIIKEKSQGFPESISKFMTYMEEFYGMLDPPQKKVFMADVRKKARNF